MLRGVGVSYFVTKALISREPDRGGGAIFGPICETSFMTDPLAPTLTTSTSEQAIVSSVDDSINLKFGDVAMVYANFVTQP